MVDSSSNGLEKLKLQKNRISRKEEKDKRYFGYYESIRLHNAMLKDKPRMEFYYEAIVRNSQMFKNKTVLDVGCGLGILSMFAAKAGAKKVYAIEAAEKVADLAKEVIMKNKMDDIVQVIKGTIEDFEVDDTIDIIISEWMGYCLVYELMLQSVMLARDRFKPKIIIPNQGLIYICGFEDDSYFQACGPCPAYTTAGSKL